MKKKIFWRIFALSALSVLLVFLFALYAVNRNSQHVVEERLIAESELLSCVLKQPDDIDRLRDYTDRDQFRITVIDRRAMCCTRTAPTRPRPRITPTARR